MFLRKQESQYYPEQGFQDQIDSMLQDDQFQSESNNFGDASILERYLFNDYQILNQNQLVLSSLCYFRDKADLDKKMAIIRSYLNKLYFQSSEQMKKRNRKDQISSEFKIDLEKIPDESVLYFSIYQINDNRFNMLVRNIRGECIAYYWKQRNRKKLNKILVFLAKLKRSLMVVVVDRTIVDQVNINEVVKISKVAKQFVYVYENAEQSSLKLEGHNLRSGRTIDKENNCSIQLYNNGLIIQSPNLVDVSETDILQYLLSPLTSFQYIETEALQSLRGCIDENDRDLEVDFIAMNIMKTFECIPSQIIVIIQKLYKKQQQAFEHNQNKQLGQSKWDKNSQLQYSHLPGEKSSRVYCVRCHIEKKKPKKIKFKCDDCTITFKRDIYLCFQCFRYFHHNIQLLAPRVRSLKSKRFRRRILTRRQPKSKLLSQLNEKNSMQKEAQNSESLVEVNRKESIDLKTTNIVIKLDKIINETFEIVRSQIDKKTINEMELFLLFSFDMSIQKMKQIAQKHPHLNTGMTKAGALAGQKLQQQQKKGTKSSRETLKTVKKNKQGTEYNQKAEQKNQ